MSIFNTSRSLEKSFAKSPAAAAALYLITQSGSALAQGAAAAGPSTVEMLIMPAGFLLIMYFFMIRPQQKRAKDHQAFIASLKAGDEVVTSGGIIGRVRTVAEGFISVEIANNTVIKVLKSSIESQSPKAAASSAAVKAD
jgi:preprotein translocase subunit YajC